MTDDKGFLRRAVETAGSGINNGGGPFGAVITKDGKVIAVSNNRVVLDADPTAHAEILAIREAARLTGTHILDGCVLYSSCEPCPMCLGAIYWARPNRVFYAATKHDASHAGFDDSFIYDEIPKDKKIRSIPFIQLSQQEAVAVFNAWNDKEDKVRY